MRWFLRLLIAPLLSALEPRTIVEVGIETGYVTRALLDWAAQHDGVVHAVDSAPSLDPPDILEAHQDRLTLHTALSLEVLERIADVDLVLIDGDHNWYTVINELRVLTQTAVGAGRLPPVILLHDVGWPYARRDMYYAPETIPAKFRHEHAQVALVPGESGFAEVGLNDHVANAVRENTPANGVLTAVEDFIAESDLEWELHTIPGFNGLGILVDTDVLVDRKGLRDFLASLDGTVFLRELAEELERSRVSYQISAVTRGRQLAAAQTRLSDTTAKLGASEAALAGLRAELELAGRGATEADPFKDDRVVRELQALRARHQEDLDAEAARLEVRMDTLRAGVQRDLDDARAVAERLAGEADQAGAALAAAQAGEREARQAEMRAREALAELTAADATARRPVERLQRQLELTESERAELEQELEARLADLRTLRRRLREADQSLEDARETSEQERAARQRADRTVAAAEEAAGEHERHLHALRAELSDRITEVGELKARLEQGVERNHELAQELAATRDGLRGQLDLAAGQLEAAVSAEQALRAELAEREQETFASSAQRARLQAALARARVDAEVAQAELEAINRRVAEAPALFGASGPALEFSEEMTLLIDEIAMLRRDRDELAARLEGGAAALLSAGSPSQAELAAVTWPPLPDDELDTQATFTSNYQREHPGLAGGPLTADSGLEPEHLAARPGLADRRGMLVAVGEPQGAGPSVDVVICVHNALEDVRTCIWSLLNKSSRQFALILVNDGSDAATTELLDRFAGGHPAVTLIDHQTGPHGYTIAANLGMKTTRGDYVILLNSDTIVTPGWMERIIDHGEAHPEVGVLGPMSNAASHQSVPELRSNGAWATNPLPPWLNPDAIALILERDAPRTHTRLPFLNGFCYVIKRQTLDAVGWFDEENFASGYCEENDFSHRARQAGYELAVVDDAYVYHAKSRSFGVEGRSALAKRNYEIFLDKHGREKIQELVRGMEANRSLMPVRAAVSDAISTPQSLGPALIGAKRPLEIVFILPGLGDGGSGGSHSIYQEVSGLRQLGVPARIVLAQHAWKRAQRAYDDADEVFETFADLDELAARTRSADVISATHFKSMAMLQDLWARRQDFVPAYYIQDYEPFFTSDPDDVEEAVRSYTAIPELLTFAKTHWLCNMVGARHRIPVAKVTPSIDETVYRPSGSIRAGDGPLRVCAMLRPRTPRRQPFSTVGVLERLISEFGDRVQVSTFGCGDADVRHLTDSAELRSGHRGILKRAAVARLLSEGEVFLDMSTYQAFGRTALEAMACGCTAIVPRIGGAWEFLEDGVNGLAVDTLDRESSYAALASLVGSGERLLAMRQAARDTALGYSVLGASVSEYLLFDAEHQRRMRDPAATATAS